MCRGCGEGLVCGRAVEVCGGLPFSGGHGAHVPLIKIQLTRFGDMAGASRVRPIINIHYLSSPGLRDALTHAHAHANTHTHTHTQTDTLQLRQRSHQCENEINTPSLSFVMKCLSCSFIWWSAQSSKTSNSAKRGAWAQCKCVCVCVCNTVVGLCELKSCTLVSLTPSRKVQQLKGKKGQVWVH